MNVYLDNAATTPLDPLVLEAMMPYMKDHFGNPSSTHAFGRKTKNAIEISRKKVADYLNAEPSEIIFTSGGTEADNMALRCGVMDLGVKRIITSSIEHHAVGHTAEHLRDHFNVQVEFVNLKEDGHVDVEHLEELLAEGSLKTMVSLMHGNNEIGNLLSLEIISNLCKKHKAYFHSDTVQTMGHYRFDMKTLDIDFITGAAHKFHGPKGVGFLYINKNTPIEYMMSGGSQERGHRGGTENLYGIVGLAKAMEIAHDHMEEHQVSIQGLKTYMKEQLQEMIPNIIINGEENSEKSLYTVLSVCFPLSERSSMFLFNLDINGVYASGGSACTAGSNMGSHVLAALPNSQNCQPVRFSFGRFTTKEEIDYALEKVREMVAIPV
ncbi:cysteine desulfurase [Flavobacteriales bacterium]|nr:cysteine desulfurase [Flavobacteriales bacterium]